MMKEVFYVLGWVAAVVSLNLNSFEVSHTAEHAAHNVFQQHCVSLFCINEKCSTVPFLCFSKNVNDDEYKGRRWQRKLIHVRIVNLVLICAVYPHACLVFVSLQTCWVSLYKKVFVGSCKQRAKYTIWGNHKILFVIFIVTFVINEKSKSYIGIVNFSSSLNKPHYDLNLKQKTQTFKGFFFYLSNTQKAWLSQFALHHRVTLVCYLKCLRGCQNVFS